MADKECVARVTPGGSGSTFVASGGRVPCKTAQHCASQQGPIVRKEIAIPPRLAPPVQGRGALPELVVRAVTGGWHPASADIPATDQPRGYTDGPSLGRSGPGGSDHAPPKSPGVGPRSPDRARGDGRVGRNPESRDAVIRGEPHSWPVAQRMCRATLITTCPGSP
jgi:hypothetical protein